MSNQPLTPTVLPDILYVQSSEHVKLKIKSSDLEKLGSGGTAVVYSYTHDHVTKAIKIYHQEVLEKYSHEYSQKLKNMLRHKPEKMEFTLEGDSQTYTQFVWPEAIVCDKDGQLLGYIMPILPRDKLIPLSTYNNPNKIGKINKNHISITYRIQTARNLASAMNSLHKAGHYFIDVKPQNIFIFEEKGLVCFLDCDGYSINQGEFPAKHYTNGYQLPEALRQGIKPVALSKEPYQDYYCLAHLIFEILNYGNKPFNGLPTDQSSREEMESDEGGSYTYKVKHKWYPYALKSHPSIKPSTESIYQYLPKEILQLFEKAFIGQVSEIPNAKTWSKVLAKYCTKETFQKCDVKPNSFEHHHFRALGCFACALEDNSRVKSTIIDDEIEQTSISSLVGSEDSLMSLSRLLSTTGNSSVSSQSLGHSGIPIPALDEWIEFADNYQIPSNQIPRNYQELKELRVLDLSHLRLPTIPVIAGFTNLEELYLNNNQLRNLEFKAYSLPNLRVINLSSNELYELPKSICSLESLEALYVANNELSFLNSAQLLNLKNLSVLSIENNKIENFSPYHLLKYLPNLTVYDEGNPYKKKDLEDSSDDKMKKNYTEVLEGGVIVTTYKSSNNTNTNLQGSNNQTKNGSRDATPSSMTDYDTIESITYLVIFICLGLFYSYTFISGDEDINIVSIILSIILAILISLIFSWILTAICARVIYSIYKLWKKLNG